MKKLYTLWLRLFDKNFEAKVKSARLTTKMIMEATEGKLTHFYDEHGDKIRGYSNKVISTRNHHHHYHPLIAKYQ